MHNAKCLRKKKAKENIMPIQQHFAGDVWYHLSVI
jgi:hypothetical protein